MKRILFILAILLAHESALAKTYNVTKDSTATFSIPYTFGTHEGKSSKITGSFQADQSMNLTSAKIEIPISSLDTGSQKRDCHMREALGLDYTKSKFPSDHVCNSQNQIPDQGVDSISFPNIIFELEGSSRLTLGKNSVRGKWTIHGVSKTSNVDITISRSKNDNPSYIIEGSEIIKLEDFGIKVKPFAMVKVKDQALASFRLVFAP